MKHTIDATGKKLGRVASEAAIFLIGKDQVGFAKNKTVATKVEVINAAKADINEKKLLDKTYSRYSGYPGGLKQPTMRNVIEKKGFSEIFTLAIYGMIPRNKLRAKIMKNLTVKE
jgi:large subunit ribosomal protein L13